MGLTVPGTSGSNPVRDARRPATPPATNTADDFEAMLRAANPFEGPAHTNVFAARLDTAVDPANPFAGDVVATSRLASSATSPVAQAVAANASTELSGVTLTPEVRSTRRLASGNLAENASAYRVFSDMRDLVHGVMSEFPKVYGEKGSFDWSRMQGSLIETAMSAIASRVPGSGISVGAASDKELAGTPMGKLFEALKAKGLITTEENGVGGNQVVGIGGIGLTDADRSSVAAIKSAPKASDAPKPPATTPAPPPANPSPPANQS